MKTVIVLKPYLKYEIGQVIQVRHQDYDLLKPRGIVGDIEPEGEDEEVQVKKAAKMTTKTVIKKK